MHRIASAKRRQLHTCHFEAPLQERVTHQFL